MLKFNTKSLVRWGLAFFNLRFHFRLMTRLRIRKNRIFFIFEGKEYTYRDTYAQSMRYARFFLSRRKKLVNSGRLGAKERLTVGIYQENRPEYVFAIFGAAISNSVLFALNTGFRGDTLAAVINQARISTLLSDGSAVQEIEKIIPAVQSFSAGDIFFAEDRPGEAGRFAALDPAVDAAQDDDCGRYRLRIVNTSAAVVIYTSGTTGIPKGVPCTHVKLWGAGAVTRFRIGMRKSDRGYICMPLFHSNALYLGVMPLLMAGGSFVLRRKFSASAFEEDMLTHGVTYLNYVGQPLHYIIAALEKKHGSGDAVVRALANHPDNRFRIAHGNGSSPVDREKLTRYLNMDHIYELYGSTEATITTANRPGDPIESVGRVPSGVVILNGEGAKCPPGVVDDRGALVNYEEAVGEICRKIGKDNVFFDGYHDNNQATDQKFRGGYYHSGDLGHVREAGGTRYLFFNGRTDDWIRKDGENFSAESVLQYAHRLPGVELAVAYGVPCEVSDEKVMISVQMKKGARFDPEASYAWFMDQQRAGGMDPKWMPDYIRVIDAFPLTNTQKIVVRPYKRDHFNIKAIPDMEAFFRRRGDTSYHPLTMEIYQNIENEFSRAGRLQFLAS